MLQLIGTEEWCESCRAETADVVLIGGDDAILGWYCGPCGERELEIAKERRKPRAGCHFNENSNRQCMLDDHHTGDHDLPCIEASAHGPHAKGSAAADGNLYQCSGHRFDRT